MDQWIHVVKGVFLEVADLSTTRTNFQLRRDDGVICTETRGMMADAQHSSA